jgi:thiosulfate/3-mercaptopyruvate sulfurtransferase
MANANEWAHPELLVDTAWLADHLDDPQVRIVDCDGPPRVERLHIPGAVFAPTSSWKGDGNETDLYGIDDSERFAELVGGMGIDNETLVIAYDGCGGMFAARLWWTLHRFGYDNCRLLDGGLDAWYDEGRPLVHARPQVAPRTFTALPPSSETLCDLDGILAAQSGDTTLLDVRTAAEWRGMALSEERGGHIPGATHLLWSDVMAEPVRRFKSPQEVASLFQAQGLESDQPVITYCWVGMRASHTLFTLRLCGYDHVRMYDASWREYGNLPDTPIVKP